MQCGIGIRPELFEPVFAAQPSLGFLEAHSENYFGESLARDRLLRLRETYPISLHGVGLSLGRADHLSQSHLGHLKSLVNDVDPLFVSEHLAWSAYSHRHVPDLLPLPLSGAALSIMCEHVDQMQSALGHQVLVENPSNYLVFDELQIPEPEFLNELAARTGCGLLIDVNNIYVSACNTGRDGRDYVSSLSSKLITQYHLAGYTEVSREVEGEPELLLIDTHDHTVYDPVWELFDYTLARHGAKPTLFEWDSDFPELSVLMDECEKANRRLALSQQGETIEPFSYGRRSPSILTADTTASKAAADKLSEMQEKFLSDVFRLSRMTPIALGNHKHRLAVYQNNVFGTLQDYLSEVYPATKGVVGDPFFKQMVQRFVQHQAPASGNMHDYGADFQKVVRWLGDVDNLPYLPDLIKYEWAIHSAFFSTVSNSLDSTKISQDKLLLIPVRFNDSVTIVESTFPIFEIHRQSLPAYNGEVTVNLEQSRDTILVFKSDDQVQRLCLEENQALFLLEVSNSENLLQSIEGLQGSLSEDDMSSTLAMLFGQKLLVSESEASNLNAQVA